MTRVAVATAVCLLVCHTAMAQPVAVDKWAPALPTATARKAADIASWAAALATTALDVKASCVDSPDRKGDCLRLGLRTTVTYAAVLGVKKWVHRRRPCAPECGIDNPDFSFYSAHTALAFQSVNFRQRPGPRLVLALPLAIGAGAGRDLAGKHYASDVMVGAGAGLLASLIR